MGIFAASDFMINVDNQCYNFFAYLSHERPKWVNQRCLDVWSIAHTIASTKCGKHNRCGVPTMYRRFIHLEMYIRIYKQGYTQLSQLAYAMISV